MPTQKPSKQRNLNRPPFHTDDFKIVYRPQARLGLSKWSLTAITHAIGRSSGLTQRDFYDNVRVQMQIVENIIIASTADTERATKLRSITTIQLGGTIFSVNPHVRHPDDVCRGVIYGLFPARMLGRSSTAVITFDGPHVPYYITYQSGDYRCKPYRTSVQYCRKCGAIGHRQDICPRPREDFCYKCRQGAVTEARDCLPKCRICEQAHETAGKECKKKLRPNPHLIKCDNNSTRGKPERMAVVHEARTSPSWTYPLAAPAAHNEASPAEAGLGLSCGRAPRLAQGPARAPPIESAMLMQHENNQLTAIAAPMRPVVVESRLEALVQAKFEPITVQIGDTFTTLSRRMDTHTAQINELNPPRDQLTDYDHFISELRKCTRGHRLVVVRDFNAPHTAWGCAITTKKGARVHDVAQKHGLTDDFLVILKDVQSSEFQDVVRNIIQVFTSNGIATTILLERGTKAADLTGNAVTPFILQKLTERTAGATLRASIL
ncbi:hypothetical protein HPB52_005443 [Rhipicephalus sanguineus]|uniref:Endonuclease/exonuclease/phosphatase domain-containing protein n=1 Tax=Rhipicephalus sanguineus TaxID=34632 RepID=A0A9D4T2N0_RHISA|nr:hypothetical protein HPB52_005443 [Rhipicephalus sanguineus]